MLSLCFFPRYCLAKIPAADDEEFKYTCGKCLLSSTKKASSKQPLLRNFCPGSLGREYNTHSIDPSAAIKVPKTRQGNIISSVAQSEPMTLTHHKLLPSLLTSVSKHLLNGINGSPDKINHPAVLIADLNIGEASTSSPVHEVGAKVQARNICPFPETAVSDPLVEDLLIEANMSKSKISLHCYGLNSNGDQEPKRKRRRVVHDVVKFDKLAEGQELNEVSVVQVDSVSSAGPLGSPSPHTSIQDPSYVYAQPIIDPTWRLNFFSYFLIQRIYMLLFSSFCPIFYLGYMVFLVRGSFEICREKIGRLVAHLSNKACSKVVEVAKLMPAVLSMKMLPRLELWPKSFSASAPTDEHIALYFFPGTERFAVFNKLLLLLLVFGCACTLYYTVAVL